MAKYSKEQRPPPTPKRPKPWDPPPIRTDHGDKSASVTFAAVGRALSQWEKFEIELAKLFAALVGGDPTSTAPAARAYGAIQTFRGRAEMIEAAAESFFAIFPESELKKRTDELLKVAKNWASRRNEVAHGIVREPHWIGGKKWAALFPASYTTNRNKLHDDPSDPQAWATQRPVYVYTSEEIARFTEGFRELEDEAESCAWGIGAHRVIEMKRAQDRAEQAKRKP